MCQTKYPTFLERKVVLGIKIKIKNVQIIKKLNPIGNTKCFSFKTFFTKTIIMKTISINWAALTVKPFNLNDKKVSQEENKNDKKINAYIK